MAKYSLTTTGHMYLLNPSRNKRGCITVKYFRNTILIYMLSIKEAYRPEEFKNYIESLGILDEADEVLMTTRNYPIWKHHIDRAKQWLLDNQYIYEKEERFYISSAKIDKIYNELSPYIKRK